MKIIGLTGGIGSGKSLVAQIFSTLGVSVFEADNSGRKMLAENPKVIAAVKALLGDATYKNGIPDRAYIAEAVFNNQSLLAELNAIIHPAVSEDFAKWKATIDADYCLREAAILFESGSNKDCDQVICVSAPDEMRIARVIDRDKVDRRSVELRMQKQWSTSKKEALSDHVIQNDGVSALIPQVLNLHQQLMASV